MEDYYQILGVRPNASLEEIKERFRFLAHAYHPDKFSSSTHKKYAEETFKKINEAYQILSDSVRRAEYDKRRPSSDPRDEKERRRREEAEAARRRAEEEAEAARQHAEEEQRKREEAEAIRRRAQEEQRKREEAEAARRRAEEEQRKREEAKAARRHSKVGFLILALLTVAYLTTPILSLYRPATLPRHLYLETEQSSPPADEKSLTKDLITIPPPQGFVSDFAGVIDPTTRQQLTRLLQELKDKTGAEIAVVTVETTQPLTPFEYALKIAETWKPGAKGKDNGVVFLVATKDRKMFIATGYGVEGVLPDGKVGAIQDESIVPYFKQGDYARGILTGTQIMASLIAQEYGVSLYDNLGHYKE